MYSATIKGIASSKPLYSEEFEDKKTAEDSVNAKYKEYADRNPNFTLNYWTKVEWLCEDCGGTQSQCNCGD